MALERELDTYRQKLPALAKHEGKFVLIRGEEVVDVFSSYEDALKAGYKAFALEPFLVKQIQVVEQAQFLTRPLTPGAAPSEFAPT